MVAVILLKEVCNNLVESFVASLLFECLAIDGIYLVVESLYLLAQVLVVYLVLIPS